MPRKSITSKKTEEKHKAKKVENETWSGFGSNLKIAGIEVLSHTLVTIMCLASIAVVHYALKYLLGEDAKLFDSLKVKYLIDAADIVVLIRLVLGLIKDTFNLLRK